jgi:methyl-accepting chemotaxis protein
VYALIQVADMMKDISKGDGDLTKRLTIYAKDEIGTAVRRVHDLSGENKRHIDVLVDEISKFKVES